MCCVDTEDRQLRRKVITDVFVNSTRIYRKELLNVGSIRSDPKVGKGVCKLLVEASKGGKTDWQETVNLEDYI